jgi:hypothetical protein
MRWRNFGQGASGLQGDANWVHGFGRCMATRIEVHVVAGDLGNVCLLGFEGVGFVRGLQ